MSSHRPEKSNLSNGRTSNPTRAGKYSHQIQDSRIDPRLLADNTAGAQHQQTPTVDFGYPLGMNYLSAHGGSRLPPQVQSRYQHEKPFSAQPQQQYPAYIGQRAHSVTTSAAQSDNGFSAHVKFMMRGRFDNQSNHGTVVNNSLQHISKDPEEENGDEEEEEEEKVSSSQIPSVDYYFSLLQNEQYQLRNVEGFPQTAASQQKLIQELHDALLDCSEIIETTTKTNRDPIFVMRLKTGHYSKLDIEKALFKLLIAVGRATNGRISIANRYTAVEHHNTFKSRFDAVVKALKYSKNLCKQVVDPHFIDKLADSPSAQIKLKKSNKSGNAHRDNVLAKGFEALKSEDGQDQVMSPPATRHKSTFGKRTLEESLDDDIDEPDSPMEKR